MSDPRSNADVSKLLDELLKATSSCYCCFGKIEESSGVEVNEVKYELEKASEKVNMNDHKTYAFSDGKKKEISNEMVKNYQESLLNVNMIDVDSRNGKNEVEIDFRFKYLNEIVRYMANEYDINKLNGVEFDEFCRELMEMRIPFKMDIMNRIFNDFNGYGIRWKNRCLMVNGHDYKMMMNYMKLCDMKYNEKQQRIEYSIDDKYEPIIQSFSNYLQDKSKGDELRSVIDRKLLNSFVEEYPLDMNSEDVQDFFYPIYSPFLKESVINEEKYDDKLREWLGSDNKWKLLYRASEHGYTAESFHEYCDDRGPTLIIIKSSGGWIFGGYTTQSWREDDIHDDIVQFMSIYGDKDDDKAFIFTLKNPHGAEPTHFMKKVESDWAIRCRFWDGPIFGNDDNSDIHINDNCNKENSCSIYNDDTHGYECHPQYRSSLFVNTAGLNEENKFSVLDYEVFGIDYENRYNINRLCKYPDVIWEYIKTNDISEESLKQFDDDARLLSDLDAIHCDDSNIRFKISQYYFKNPSEFLPDTQLINQQYDTILREWTGDYKWRLIYRASEHEYTTSSFHECCDDKGSTLIVIKSSEGWIFGGYTTQSWKVVNPNNRGSIYYDMIIINR